MQNRSNTNDEYFTFSEPTITIQPFLMPHNQKGAIIFLHGGVGNSGSKTLATIEQIAGQKFAFENYRILIPTAPKIPVEGNGSKVTWINFNGNGPQFPEDTPSLLQACQLVNKLVVNEIKNGTASNRIVVGGSGIGGRVALEYGCRHDQKLAGIFAMSTYVTDDSPLYETIIGQQSEFPQMPQVFMSHGIHNPVVKTEWVENTGRKLQEAGMKVRISNYKDSKAPITKKQMLGVHGWIKSTLPK